jgi:hypothetical protein
MGRVQTTKHSQLLRLLTASGGKSGAGTHSNYTFAVASDDALLQRAIRPKLSILLSRIGWHRGYPSITRPDK